MCRVRESVEQWDTVCVSAGVLCLKILKKNLDLSVLHLQFYHRKEYYYYVSAWINS